ncbi:MAG: ornithine cyclodeaminase family protein [Acidobacteria bacterium]|nr:ornithine cyclodeaminase family protein [Acidobacteriota bacterium]
MNTAGTLILKRSEVAALLTLDDCIAAVEQAFKLFGEGKTDPPGMLGIHTASGAFHIKAGTLATNRKYFAVKANANFMKNRERFGLPTIQGVIALCDAERGTPLAIMDSMEITIQRTGAATAVAAKFLAREDVRVATICGCGNQGRIQLRALARIRRIERAHAFDLDSALAEKFSRELSAQMGIEVTPVADLARAVLASDVCVCCTPARQFYLKKEMVRPGMFISAVGADSAEKHELDPALFAGNKIVVDIVEQCATSGDLHHALAAGIVTRAAVYAELGEIVAGRKPGRTSPAEITIFDSTGTALQDVAAAITVYEKAVAAGAGLRVNLAG